MIALLAACVAPNPTDTGASTPTDPGWCGADDLRFAPAPVDVDGLHAVPIDVQRLDATADLDPSTHIARAEVTLSFRVGPEGGMPIFDLRQTPDALTLDGEALRRPEYGHHRFSPQDDAQMRVIERDLPPCSTHTLTASYPLERPDAPGSEVPEVEWRLHGARWEFRMTDALPARFLEMWFPANLEWDRFGFGLALSVAADAPHVPVTNAVVTDGGPNRWQLDWARTTASGPMLELVPADEVVIAAESVAFPDGTTLDVELYLEQGVDDTDPPLMDRIRAAVATDLAQTGRWTHGDRVVVYVWPDQVGSEEYDGATTTRTASIEHELFHSWWGRGVRPANGRSGWLDEAWDMYATETYGAFEVEEMTKSAWDPVVMDDGDDWGRMTDQDGYDVGMALFGHLAFVMGLDELQGAMAAFYDAHAPDPVTTEDLEAFLYCRAEDPEVVDAFWRWVYGRRGSADALPACSSRSYR